MPEEDDLEQRIENLKKNLGRLIEQSEGINDENIREDIESQINVLRASIDGTREEYSGQLQQAEREKRRLEDMLRRSESRQRRRESFSNASYRIRSAAGPVIGWGLGIAAAITLVGVVVYYTYTGFVGPMIVDNIAHGFREAVHPGITTIEKYEKEDPVMLSRVFKGEANVKYDGEDYYLRKILDIKYSPGKKRGAILYDGFHRDKILIFNKTGPLMFRSITEDISGYYLYMSELYWEDNNTLTFKKKHSSGGNAGYMKIDINSQNIGHNLRQYTPR